MKKSAWLTKEVVLKGIATLAIGGAAISLAYGLQTGYVKTGFFADTTITKIEKRDPQGTLIETTTSTTPQGTKTLWDWLSLLGVPFSVVILGYVLQQLQQAKQNVEKDIAESNKREEALQNYLDRMSELLIDKNLMATATRIRSSSKNHSEDNQPDPAIRQEKDLLNSEKCAIRATTLSILRRLGEDGERKGKVIQFLVETGIISKLKLNLSGANLSFANLDSTNLDSAQLNEANLSFANLKGAHLSGAYLRKANLSHAYLKEADLNNTYLRGADFSDADLNHAQICNAQLRGADLHNADLNMAKLQQSDLYFANFGGANLSNADLRDTDLSRTKKLTQRQLEVAKLGKTKLPKWITLNLNLC